jgi:glycosyltransferase involved in cell wall biosynthesis
MGGGVAALEARGRAPRPRLVYYLDPAAYGGAVKYVERLIRNLDRQEFDVHVICPTDVEMAPLLAVLAECSVTIHPLKPVRYFKQDVYEATKTPRPALRAFIRAARLPILREATKATLAVAGLLRDWHQAKRVQRAVAETRPTILHVNCDQFPDNTGRLAVSIGHRAGARAVLATVHQRPQPPVFPRGLNHYYDRHALRAADRVVVLARRFLPLFREWYGARDDTMTVIYNGSPPAYFEDRPSLLRREDLGVSQQAVLVVHVGSVMPARGQVVLAQALISLTGRCPQLEAVFVGRNMDQRYLSTLQDLIGRAPGARLRWIGYRDDAIEVMRLADIAVVSSFQEAHPFALIEAMATGRAVVATDVGAVAETIRDGVSGLLVPPGSVGAMADSVRQLYESPALRESLGQAARNTARDRFTESRMVGETVSLYRGLLGRA